MQEVKLKFHHVQSSQVDRGDIIMIKQQILQCVSKHANLFMNLGTRQQKQISAKSYVKLQKLELIPKKWSIDRQKIMLNGQQLGLGPIHYIEVTGMKQFPQMNIVNQELQKGRKVEYKVILCKTIFQKVFMVVGIDLL